MRSAWRFYSLVLALAGAALVGAALSLSPREDPSAAAPSRPAVSAQRTSPPPGVILICLDTLRADALSLDSGRPVRMPRLEAFARESVAFADAVSGSAWTVPSVASLLTGLDSRHTGVFGLPDRYADLSPSVPTLAKRLRDRGYYASCATTGAWIAPDSSLTQGFRDGVVGLDANPEEVLAAWNRRRPADAPFFLFIHSLAAHDPYLDKAAEALPISPVAPQADERILRIAARLKAGATPLETADMRWIAEGALGSGALRSERARAMGREASIKMIAQMPLWLDGECETDPLVPELAARLREAYERSLGDVDRQVGRILDGLDRLRLPVGTALLIVADHGEAFAEHGTLTHGRRLFDEVIRVPLLVRAADRLGPPRVVHGACGLVDVAPTILDLAGVTGAATMDGISLVSVATRPLPERAIRGLEERRRFTGRDVRVEVLESVRTARAKCILRRDTIDRRLLGAECFDLLADPREQHPFSFELIDHPRQFGDAFAAAVESLGLPLPRDKAVEPGTQVGRPGG